MVLTTGGGSLWEHSQLDNIDGGSSVLFVKYVYSSFLQICFDVWGYGVFARTGI